MKSGRGFYCFFVMIDFFLGTSPLFVFAVQLVTSAMMNAVHHRTPSTGILSWCDTSNHEIWLPDEALMPKTRQSLIAGPTQPCRDKRSSVEREFFPVFALEILIQRAPRTKSIWVHEMLLLVYYAESSFHFERRKLCYFFFERWYGLAFKKKKTNTWVREH